MNLSVKTGGGILKSVEAIILITGVAILVPTLTHAVPLTVMNPSFEFPTHPLAVNCGVECSFTPGIVTDWVVTGSSGVFHPDASRINLPLPDGNQTAYSNGGSISQTLAATLQSDTTYTLTVAVGRRLDGLFPGYSVALFAGGTLLGSESALVPASGDFALSTVTFTSALSDPLAGQALSIVLGSVGNQTNFDDVGLDAASGGTPIPEPGTLLLLGTGLVCVFRHGRRSRGHASRLR